MHWNGFSACITIDGRVADGFATTVSPDKKQVTCWIASEVGKNFIVHWRNDTYRDFDTRTCHGTDKRLESPTFVWGRATAKCLPWIATDDDAELVGNNNKHDATTNEALETRSSTDCEGAELPTFTINPRWPRETPGIAKGMTYR
uniref:Uncharacterized protein n=1 Tax=Mycena chlorophos TaxID=658473 RepID=A0ABQ0M742_MYCCL|nr:predicted protein [Mycena chlorophos]